MRPHSRRARAITLAGLVTLGIFLAACGQSLSGPSGASGVTNTAVASAPTATSQPPPTVTPVPAPTATLVPATQSPPTVTPVTLPTGTPVPPPTSTAVTPPTNTPVTSPTVTPVTPPTGTPAPTFAATPPPQTTPQVAYAYLYSRIDYPLQIPVGGHDIVTLTLAPDAGILSVAPAGGTGTTQAVPPIALPTDLPAYRDIGVTAGTSGAATPIAWQLITAPRLSLLTGLPGDSARQYHQAVFQWNVVAVAAGTNQTMITITLFYVYLNGVERDGPIQVTDAPPPLVAVAPTALNTTLPPLKLPVSLLGLLGAVIGVGRFLWSIYQKFSQMVGTTKDAAELAAKVRPRRATPAGPGTTRKRRP